MSQTSRNCPDCGSPMTRGFIIGRSPGVKFKESSGVLGDLTGVPITKGMFNHSADAFRCPGCGLVVIPARA
ncbi:MAG TPA: PF20097 family protein [Propionibacteriaceae bacterium]|jgi:predicted RNA-binding Zn-ribbon protein involved in translation (DUF1610 family)|nr:PF20097 family protein [Propionibacteriaceae bacterium]